MTRRRTPQDKKQASLQRDCRNLVAESQWGARDAIRRRKQWVNASHRRAVRQRLTDLSGAAPADPVQVESDVAAAPRHGWRKRPDVPLAVALRVRRSRHIHSNEYD